MIVTAALLIAGTLALTLAVIGVVRFGDTFARLHAASKAVVIGVVSILLATAGTGEPELVARALLVAGFAVLTSPVSSHALARREHLSRRQRGERRD